MKSFVLTEDLLTNINDIDEDHRTIIEVANNTIATSFRNINTPIFKESFQFLKAYVSFHFASEEILMIETSYKGMKNHTRFHEHFQGEITELENRERMDGMSKDLMVKISLLFSNWIWQHIRFMDGALAKHLHQIHDAPIRLPDVRTLKNMGKLPEDFDERIAR